MADPRAGGQPCFAIGLQRQSGQAGALRGGADNYFEQRTGSNYGTGNACGMEYKGGATLNALTSAMVATTSAINAAGTSGYVEFWLQSLTLEATDGWTFELDSGSGYVTRLSELTGSSHGWQKYHYDLAAGELVGTLKMRFQFTGGGASDDDRMDLDQITVTVTSGTLPVEVTMYDDGAHGDGAAGDHVYGGQIPAMANGTTVSYYVTATDNAGLTSSDPATAPTDKYSYIVGHATPQLQLNEFLAESTTFTATSDYPAPTVGLSINTVEAMPGYTLLDPMHGKTTYLIDNAGQIVHSWTSAYEPVNQRWIRPVLFLAPCLFVQNPRERHSETLHDCLGCHWDRCVGHQCCVRPATPPSGGATGAGQRADAGPGHGWRRSTLGRRDRPRPGRLEEARPEWRWSPEPRGAPTAGRKRRPAPGAFRPAT